MMKKTPSIIASSPTIQKSITCKSPVTIKSESLALKKSFKESTTNKSK
jgi:hypothetical protein